MNAYEYRHIIGFEETTLVGNVYYVNHFCWQGRARELFLREHAPEILAELEHGFALITLRCSCEYMAELKAFDEISVRMFLVAMVQNRIGMKFEYWRENQPRELVARGEQEIACMHRQDERLVPVAIPKSLREALTRFDHATGAAFAPGDKISGCS
jgi:enediyne core biosynthesis thioesterase